MISPAEVKEKVERLYPDMIAAWLRGETFAERRVPANFDLPRDPCEAKKLVEAIRSKSKQETGSGYTLLYKERNSRIHKRNTFPIGVQLDTRSDMLRLIGLEQEFGTLEQCVSMLRAEIPELNQWLLEKKHWKELLKVADDLSDLLLVTKWLVQNPKPDCFVREVPLPISTKLIESNKKILSAWLDRLRPSEHIDFRFAPKEFEGRYGLRYSRHHLLLRCLDSDLRRQLGLPFDELSLPVHSLASLPVRDVTVFIVENKVNLLTLPQMPRSIALGGLGSAISLMEDVHWLRDAGIYYWGDLDVEGFGILSQFRSMFPQTRSLLMELADYERHSELAIEWKNRRCPTPVALTPSEHETYNFLLAKRMRLEQERIPQDDVNAVLNGLKK